MSNMTLNGHNIFRNRIRKQAVLYYGKGYANCCGHADDKFTQPALNDWISIGTLLADQYLESIKIVKITGLGAGGSYKIGLRFRGVDYSTTNTPEVIEFLKPLAATADVTSETEALVIAPALASLDTTGMNTNFRMRTIGEIVEWLKEVKKEYFVGTYGAIYGAFDLCIQLVGTSIPANFAIEGYYNYSVN